MLALEGTAALDSDGLGRESVMIISPPDTTGDLQMVDQIGADLHSRYNDEKKKFKKWASEQELAAHRARARADLGADELNLNINHQTHTLLPSRVQQGDDESSDDEDADMDDDSAASSEDEGPPASSPAHTTAASAPGAVAAAASSRAAPAPAARLAAAAPAATVPRLLLLLRLRLRLLRR